MQWTSLPIRTPLAVKIVRDLQSVGIGFNDGIHRRTGSINHVDSRQVVLSQSASRKLATAEADPHGLERDLVQSEGNRVGTRALRLGAQPVVGQRSPSSRC